MEIRSALLTDFYQLTMLQGYYKQGMEDTAVFEFFVRSLPKGRNYLVACGLDDVLAYLEDFHLTAAELVWLRKHGFFTADFIDWLAGLRFSGDVHALAEGTIFFPDEPVIQITAPLPQAQIIESRLINILHYQTLVASKAARCVQTAADKLLVDFGMRRAHGGEAALFAARASYIAGFSGTATTLAGPVYGIPVYGTMAHSFIQCHDNEKQAFRQFAQAQPDNVVLLIDTYDTEAGAQKVVDIAAELQQQGITIKAVRLDSGDLLKHSQQVRRILDSGGLEKTGIFCSGNLDEYSVNALLDNDAPITGFGIGTLLDTSADAPFLDCAYKLQEYAGRARRKRSEGKATWPGRKQVYRFFDAQGFMAHDLITTMDDTRDSVPLLQPFMENGKRIKDSSIDLAREHLQQQLGTLPEAARSLNDAFHYQVDISASLQVLTREVDETTNKLMAMET